MAPTPRELRPDAPDDGSPVRVLFIGGAGRSGSTLLGLLLGGLPGFTFHGELRWLWRRVAALDQLCSCRDAYPRCPFWHEVGELAFGGWENVDLEGLVRDEEQVVRWRHMPTLRAGIVPGVSGREAYRRYAAATSALYRATRDAAGASILVDSSKDPPYAFYLAGLAAVDLRVVHLVRDSRAVAHSLGRRVQRPDVVGREEFLPRHSPAGAATRWDLWNGCFDLLQVTQVPTLRLHYEDLVSDPELALRRVAAFSGLSIAPAELDWLNGRSFTIDGQHVVAGNPLGLQAGPITIAADDEWRVALPRRARLTIDALTLPLLAYYGGARRGSPRSREDLARAEWQLESSADVLRVRPLRAMLRPWRERRFVYREYEAFLDRLAKGDRFRVVPLRDLAGAPRDRVLVGLRHDVDERLDAALELARLEHERGLRATYFFLHTAPYYHRPGFIETARTIQDLGHEVGLHQDLLTVLAEGGEPAQCLRDELERLREAGLAVSGIAAHGSRWCHVLGASGEYLFAGHPEAREGLDNVDAVEVHGQRIMLPKLELDEFGLAYEANRLPFGRFEHDARFDAHGRRWHPGAAELDATRPGEMIVFLVHPCYWDASVSTKTGRTLAGGMRRLVQLAGG